MSRFFPVHNCIIVMFHYGDYTTDEMQEPSSKRSDEGIKTQARRIVQPWRDWQLGVVYIKYLPLLRATGLCTIQVITQTVVCKAINIPHPVGQNLCDWRPDSLEHTEQKRPSCHLLSYLASSQGPKSSVLDMQRTYVKWLAAATGEPIKAVMTSHIV